MRGTKFGYTNFTWCTYYLRAEVTPNYCKCMHDPFNKIDLYNLAVWSLYLHWEGAHNEDAFGIN